MERTSPRDQVIELDRTLREYIPDHMPDEFWRTYGKIVAFAKQAGWPVELQNQYNKVLDERDRLQEKLDELEPKPEVWVWKYGCKHNIPNFVHCPECDG